jgi:hypothetical protein
VIIVGLQKFIEGLKSDTLKGKYDPANERKKVTQLEQECDIIVSLLHEESSFSLFESYRKNILEKYAEYKLIMFEGSGTNNSATFIERLATFKALVNQELWSTLNEI